MPTVSDIYAFMNISSKNNLEDFEVKSPRFIEHAKNQSIVFLSGYYPNYIKILNGFSSILVITTKENQERIKHPTLVSDFPRLDFTKIVNHFWGSKNHPLKIENTAIISNGAKIDSDVYIGHNCVIEDGVIIRKGVKIFHNTIIHNNTFIGENTTIEANCVIGQDGYWFTPNGQSYLDLIHCGGVKIGCNVRIGNHTNVDKGVLPDMDTIIEDNVRINEKVHIAHGVHIKELSRLGSGVIVSGEVVIGKQCWIGHNTSIKHCLNITDNVTIGMGAVVTKDLTKTGTYVGVPAYFREDLKSI